MPKCDAANEIDAQIGRNIARRRKMLGLSQTNLAHHAGISFQQIQKYENGDNRVSGSRLYQIAEILRCAPGDLFPPPGWETRGDLSGAALDECARLLLAAQPAIDAALRVAQGRSGSLREIAA